MKPPPVPPNRDSAPEVVLVTMDLAEQSFSTWSEIEAHLKDVEKQITAIMIRVTGFDFLRDSGRRSRA